MVNRYLEADAPDPVAIALAAVESAREFDQDVVQISTDILEAALTRLTLRKA